MTSRANEAHSRQRTPAGEASRLEVITGLRTNKVGHDCFEQLALLAAVQDDTALPQHRIQPVMHEGPQLRSLSAVNAGIELVPELIANLLFQFQKGIARAGYRRITTNAHFAQVFRIILSVFLFPLFRQR
jgi:hypothetical protein